MDARIARAMFRFFRDDIGGNRITDAEGNLLYEDKKASFVSREKTNWAVACPPPREGQRGETWDLLRHQSKKTYMVVTSTVTVGGETMQLHHLVDASLYMDLVQDMTDYSRELRHEKDHDGLTGLYNKGKFMQLKRYLFKGQDAIAIFNMDVNNLKYLNDTFGHDAGDQLIRKAAESLRRVESRNVLPFRVGGDEFMLIALHVTREEAEALRARWEAGLEELNQKDDGIHCVIACGMAYGEKDYDLEALLSQADERMYEDKKAKKQGTVPYR